ncbi:RNA polymerase sigma factor [Chitinophaga rupis]|nr:sigma-70 family RNA polymerase sigma factor [Chitinophaga rupis]
MTTTMSVYEEDLILLQQLKAGTPEAFTAFYEKYRRYLMIVAASILEDEMEAQDLVQDFFVDFWERQLYMRIDPGQSKSEDVVIKGYVHKVVYNRCMDRLTARKAKQKRIAHMPVQDEACAPEIRMEIAEWQQQLSWSLKTAIAQIPPLSARVFELSYIQRKSRIEVAMEMGVSPNTVKNQLLRAMKILRHHLKKG